jgi:predicted transcriptional regulator YdeE
MDDDRRMTNTPGLPRFVAGHSVRTTNAAESDPGRAALGGLWQRVTADSALLGADARIDDRLYAVLTDYASDENGAYTQVVGIGVDDPDAVAGHTALVPLTDEPRTAYPATGEMPAALIQAWMRIWEDTAHGRLRRAFTRDVEVHEPDGTAVILVATGSGAGA